MKTRLMAMLVTVLLLFASRLAAVELKYRFKPGKTYEYEYSVKESSRFATFKTNASNPPIASIQRFTLRAIDFQAGSHIIDVVSSSATYRRYIKENGELSGAPGEAGQAVPFLLSFPAGDWKVAEQHQIKQTLMTSSGALPATWNLLLKSVDSEIKIAEILFTLSIKLPEDRLRRKEITLKGRALFNYGEGVMQQAEWVSSYRFIFSNREMAVNRELWLFDRQGTGYLRLITGKD